MKALTVYKNQQDSIKSLVSKIIKNKGIKTIYAWKNTLSKKHLKNINLVISIGGDGTALSASHFLLNKPLLTVNNAPRKSEGALTTIPISQLNKKLEQIVKGNYKTEKLERIQIKINSLNLPLLALNEVFIANKKAYLISKYKIKFKNYEETQKSSGLIVSTGTGSTAWFKSAGGMPFSPQSKYIKMIIREPYKGKFSRPNLLKTIIKENEKISIIPLVPSILAIDSIRKFHLNPKDKIEIQISEHPLIRII